MRNILRASSILLALFLAVGVQAKTKQYELKLTEPVQASGVQLKAGTYEVQMDGTSLVFYQRQKEVVKVPVRSEDLQKKNDNTSVTVAQGKLIEIQLEGAKTKLMVEGR